MLYNAVILSFKMSTIPPLIIAMFDTKAIFKMISYKLINFKIIIYKMNFYFYKL